MARLRRFACCAAACAAAAVPLDQRAAGLVESSSAQCIEPDTCAEAAAEDIQVGLLQRGVQLDSAAIAHGRSSHGGVAHALDSAQRKHAHGRSPVPQTPPNGRLYSHRRSSTFGAVWRAGRVLADASKGMCLFVGMFLFLSCLSMTVYFSCVYGAGEPSEPERMAAVNSAATEPAKKLDRRATVGLQPDDSPASEGAESGRQLRRRHSFAMADMKGLRKTWTIDSSEGCMTSYAFVVNMLCDLGPPGMLPQAYAISQTGFGPAFMLLIFFCGMCISTFWMVGQTAALTGENTFKGQWAKLVGEQSALVPVAVVAAVSLGNNLSYACYYADIFTSLLLALGVNSPRWLALLMVSLFPTLPLCFLKDLSCLAPTSFFALISMLYTLAVMCVRAVDGTYKPGGLYYADLDAEFVPDVPAHHMFDFGFPAVVLVNTLAMGFLAHYNGCKYYRELQDHSPAKLRRVVTVAMSLSACIFGVSMVAGFETFGTNADGVILNNYSSNDWPINIARFGMGLSIVASFPISFSGLREAVITLLQESLPPSAPSMDLVWCQDVLSVVLLTVIVGAATVLVDSGLVVGMVGALCGSAIIYIIPSVLYAATIPDTRIAEFLTVRAVSVFGLVLMVSGVVCTLVYS